jgi:membrane-associated phospholipid phosphatase
MNISYLLPYLIFFVSIFLLQKKTRYLIYYILGYFINILLNILLKITIKLPRPTEDIVTFNSAISQGKNISIDKFGMPSGHAQNIFYSTVFIYLVLHNNAILTIYLLLSFLTSYLCIIDNHTIIQTLFGCIIGILVGYLIYYSATKNIMGILRCKKDDNAPL